ncbi:DUF2970 domain-containing protein [Sansalvadorimonas verongulae]|uniref:DUF2970 domain-containing protein n=1 Tax=Sansalvadorimonas verongulae TaxID=2172824 RepID=UPI0012BC4EAD|nr:DUF2970 domain-containing protein [Sansalvadorimonas verongulae]MTI12299.1 DUF2970 domain-containing protein [Sansalvadorimonas verongulae]
MQDNKQQDRRPPGLMSVIQSTLAAAFGVQSNKKREKDFSDGKPSQFIIAGIVFTALFVLTLLAIVNTVI